MRVLAKIFGSSNDRFIKTLQADVHAINALEDDIKALSDEQLRAKTDEFKQRLTAGKTEDDLQNEAFAVVREAAVRVLGQRHYDVQLMGGMVLHRGMITEMKTGEGKTLVSTLAAYLNALSGNGVHIVTVNDYLAARDAKTMGQVYGFLGLSTGCVTSGLVPEQRKQAYEADITYGTNNEFGFDYLRSNMKFTREEMVQRPFNYAVIDEVDSILIDEARTPLIISGPVDEETNSYVSMDSIVRKLAPEDYDLDEKNRNVNYTEDGTAHLEELLKAADMLDKDSSLYDLENVSLVHHANQALKAHTIFTREKDYIVKDNRVIIVDEFTGRMQEGRRFSEGLHQALEAKENVQIQQENQTLASVTYQNFFRMYPKLSGMTGTAMTEAGEFDDIYKLKCVEIPTHRPIARIDDEDLIFRTAEEKYAAIIDMVTDCVHQKQPVLLGTASIEQSELISKQLKKAKVKHNVLNARQHQQEAQIISMAGQPGAVTVATNMAGRGTDIQLGGNLDMLIADKTAGVKDASKKEKIAADLTTQVAADAKVVIDAGGLCVIGSERHESRRIDNQLRGRAGRQGDPGRSIFFLYTEDDLIRIFGADKKMDWVMGTMGEPGEAISHPMLTKIMEKSQQKVEARNYEIRKNLLKFDDVMNDQRTIVYDQRIELMDAEDGVDTIIEMAEDVIEDLVHEAIPEKSYPEQWDLEPLEHEITRLFGLQLPVQEWAKAEGVAEAEIHTQILAAVRTHFAAKTTQYGEQIMTEVSRQLLLFTLDELWKDHLLSLDQLRQGINLRAYAQKDPLNEYKREAFMLFQQMLSHMNEVVITRYSRMELQEEDPDLLTQREQRMRETRNDPNANRNMTDPDVRPLKPVSAHVKPEDRDPADPSTWGKIGRNEDCPCGSGKKYKQCHGKI